MENDDIFIPSSSAKQQKQSDVFEKQPNDRVFKDGSIKKLVLKNFMSHEDFALVFEPNINIITGPNGSGKSAVLQAIVLAMGMLYRQQIACNREPYSQSNLSNFLDFYVT